MIIRLSTSCQLAVGVQHLISRDAAAGGKFAVQAALHQALLHAPLGCLGGIRVCHVCKGRGLGRLGTACGVSQQQRGLGAVLGCSHAFRQQGLQLAAGNIVVHAVAHNASRHCASRRHDDDRTAATAAGRAAARGIAAGGRRYRGNGAAHVQIESYLCVSTAQVRILYLRYALIDRQDIADGATGRL